MPNAELARAARLAHMTEAAAAYDRALRATSRHRQIAPAAHAEAVRQLDAWRAWRLHRVGPPPRGHGEPTVPRPRSALDDEI